MFLVSLFSFFHFKILLQKSTNIKKLALMPFQCIYCVCMSVLFCYFATTAVIQSCFIIKKRTTFENREILDFNNHATSNLAIFLFLFYTYFARHQS
jgi:hypothetical protein